MSVRFLSHPDIALGADITVMGSERGHRTLSVLRTGGKIVMIPLAPRTERSLDLANATLES